MPIQLDTRPKSWTKPSLEENDPIINQFPFFIRDKVDEKTLKMCSVIRWFIIKEVIPKEAKYYDHGTTTAERNCIVQNLKDKAQHEYYIGHMIYGTRSKYAHDNDDLFINDYNTNTNGNPSSDTAEFNGKQPYSDSSFASTYAFKKPVFKLSPLEYGVLLQIMGVSLLSFQVIPIVNLQNKDFNSCTSINNMCAVNLIYRHGTKEQIEKYLCSDNFYNFKFLISEENCNSSDYLNTQFNIKLKKKELVLSGNKWFIPDVFNNNVQTGVTNNSTGFDTNQCKNNVHASNENGVNNTKNCWLLFGVTENTKDTSIHSKHSIVLLDEEMVHRDNLQIFQLFHDDVLNSSYYHLKFDKVSIPFDEKMTLLSTRGNGNNLLIEKTNLSKIYNSLLIIGLTQECVNRAISSSEDKIKITNKNTKLVKSDYFKNTLAEHKIDLENCKNSCYNALLKYQDFGRTNDCKMEVAMCKYMTPLKCCKIIDWCVQVHGGSSYLSCNSKLFQSYDYVRKFRVDEQPDEFLLSSIGKYEINHANKMFKTLKDLNFTDSFKK
ncbi:Acyl-CoA dehydrogenase family member 11 [Hanseniaspora osmophila]|uniref:Acyl-CoA dehydrogenase family member 11 n=1 Tax=Hanseniaspora osmophila TaxID=56408 RepID=A0A1E5R0Q3_9ASCO|nr:Acyl-CoA dehydrogenase family member 11 [Hanseniaspora osmophila]